MGGSQSTPIPGGGTEGYHILKVSFLSSVNFSILFMTLRRSHNTKSFLYDFSRIPIVLSIVD